MAAKRKPARRSAQKNPGDAEGMPASEVGNEVAYDRLGIPKHVPNERFKSIGDFDDARKKLSGNEEETRIGMPVQAFRKYQADLIRGIQDMGDKYTGQGAGEGIGLLRAAWEEAFNAAAWFSWAAWDNCFALPLVKMDFDKITRLMVACGFLFGWEFKKELGMPGPPGLLKEWAVALGGLYPHPREFQCGKHFGASAAEATALWCQDVFTERGILRRGQDQEDVNPIETYMERCMSLALEAIEKPKEIRVDEETLRRLEVAAQQELARLGRFAGGTSDGDPIKPDGISWEAKAIALLTENPAAKVKDIAKRAGVHPKTLSKNKRFTETRRLLLRMQPQGRIHRGRKDEEGHVEAVYEEDREKLDKDIDESWGR